MALALLPVSLVLDGFDNLYDSILKSPSKFNLFKPLFTYFENQWINKVGIDQWNAYGTHMRTNNNCESA